MYEDLIPALATAACIASVRLATPHIAAISDGIEQLTGIPGRLDWERKAARHAAILGLLADAVDDAAAAGVLRLGITVVGDLAVMAGPVADGMITNSHRRLLAHLRAADPDAVEHEMERLLRCLHFMGAPSPSRRAVLLLRGYRATGPQPRRRLTDWRYSHSMASLSKCIRTFDGRV